MSTPNTVRLRAWIDRYGHAGVLLAGAVLLAHYLWHPKRRPAIAGGFFLLSGLFYFWLPPVHTSREEFTLCPPYHNENEQTAYTLTDIGTPANSEYSIPQAINNKGQIVGATVFRGFTIRAFLWENGKFTDLGTLPGGGVSLATGINDKGQIVGVSGLRSGGAHAVLWENGQIRDLKALPDQEQDFSFAYGINNQGQVVGISTTKEDALHTVVWQSNGKIEDVNTGSDFSFGNGINNKGQIVGEQFSGRSFDAFLHADGKTRELPKLHGIVNGAYAVNDNGLVVGWSQYKGKSEFNFHAAAWRDGKAIDLGDLGGRDSDAFAVNDRGQIAGASYTSVLESHAAVWQQGKIRDLNAFAPSGWALKGALGINNKGQIIGVGATDGQYHGFLLTPKN